ncbi:hypothetical protein [uncultured Kordia sp.]|uniref:hypothetical protein n=1 Tax=uncultured Kordia sp. TaxID=507699 RepID=UPI00262CE732|nr:hypothetical protein [uncultured Kordia sp.]
MKKKSLKSLKLNKTEISNFDPASPKGGSVFTSYPLPNGQILCKRTYHPNCDLASILVRCED